MGFFAYGLRFKQAHAMTTHLGAGAGQAVEVRLSDSQEEMIESDSLITTGCVHPRTYSISQFRG